MKAGVSCKLAASSCTRHQRCHYHLSACFNLSAIPNREGATTTRHCSSYSFPFHGSVWRCPALSIPRRRFHSGLDERRVQRLRRSGMTFNKPRGRDAFSQAFESRIRIVAMPERSAMYDPVQPLRQARSRTKHPSPHKDSSSLPILEAPEPNPLDPTSSVGNTVRVNRAEQERDTTKGTPTECRLTAVLRERALQEQTIAGKTCWRVAVAEPLPSRGLPLFLTLSSPATRSAAASDGRDSGEVRRARESDMEGLSSLLCWTPQSPDASSALTYRGLPMTSLAVVTPVVHAEDNIVGGAGGSSLENPSPGSSQLVTATYRTHFSPLPVFFPAVHPHYYLPVSEGGVWPESDNQSISGARRSTVTANLQKVLIPGCNAPSRDHDMEAAEEANSNEAERTWNTTILYLLPPEQRRHLQKAGDASVLPSVVRRFLPALVRRPAQKKKECPPENDAAQAEADEEEVLEEVNIEQQYYLLPCLEPWLEKRVYGREEVQVELITTYRNILMECAELGYTHPDATGKDGKPLVAPRFDGFGPQRRRWSVEGASNSAVVDILRVPALGIDQWRRAGGEEDFEGSNGGYEEEMPNWHHEIGKLNQQALLKAFHRLPEEAKDALLQNPAFTVEVCVPPAWLEHFVSAFLEEAWEIPNSILRPGRTALYPGLAPPPALLQMEGWIGKRKELTEAVHTKGKSLLRGPHYQLDGRVIQEEEVLTQIKVFGAAQDLQERLKLEKETAAKEDGVLPHSGSSTSPPSTTTTTESK